MNAERQGNATDVALKEQCSVKDDRGGLPGLCPVVTEEGMDLKDE